VAQSADRGEKAKAGTVEVWGKPICQTDTGTQ
jgi:hypothetical protein